MSPTADPRPAQRLALLRRHLDGTCIEAPPAAAAFAAAPCRAADNAAVPDASKVCSAEEAVALIPDGVWLTPAGFVGTSCPELLLNALRCGLGAGGGDSNKGRQQQSGLFQSCMRRRHSILPPPTAAPPCRERFDATGTPSRLGCIFAASVGNAKTGRGGRPQRWQPAHSQWHRDQICCSCALGAALPPS